MTIKFINLFFYITKKQTNISPVMCAQHEVNSSDISSPSDLIILIATNQEDT